MAQLPLDEAVSRLKENEDRLDTFVNKSGVYSTNEVVSREVETVPSLMQRLKERYLSLLDRGDWTTATAYAINDLAKNAGTIYLCTEPHTAGTFATDKAAGKWVPYNGIEEAELKDRQAIVGVRSRPAFIEQFITGMFGRGMITAERINVTTEQTITASFAAGATSVSVSNNAAFAAGYCATIKHDNGKYRTYFVSSIGSGTIGILPTLRYPVSAGAKIERTWYNRAHPGKFYIRELAQRIAHSTEIEASAPDSSRVLFTNFASNPNTYEDTLKPLGSATINYYDATNVGSTGNVSSPARFNIGRSAFISLTANNGDGCETPMFEVPSAMQAVAKIVFLSGVSAATVCKANVIANDGTVLASKRLIGSTVAQIFDIPFYTRKAESLKVQIIIESGAVASTFFILDQIDVFKAPEFNGPIISNADAKVLVIGDSWVAGDLGNTPEREPMTTQLAIELPYATIINKGVGGNKIQDIIARFETDVTPYTPDYVVVNTGTNDTYNPASGVFYPNSVDYFINQYNWLINRIIEIGARPIIIGVPGLAESATEGGYVTWQLNDRAKMYSRYFWERLAKNPKRAGTRSGLVMRKSDKTLTDADGTTPNVANCSTVELNYASATTLTNLLGGVEDQVLELRAKTGNVTLKHGTMILNGAANVVLTNNSIITFVRANPVASSAWYEVSRSIK